MLSLALMLSLQTQTAPKTWYGPETVTFQVAFSGNPYDIEKSDLRVRFTDSKGNTVDRLAFYDAEETAWKAVLVADKPGRYRPVLYRNGAPLDAEAQPDVVELPSKPISKGFIRLDNLNKGKFAYDDGKPYLPLGYNLGWQSGGQPDLTETLKTMGQNGINWSRIWACAWDGKNPWVPQNGEADEDRMLPKAFERWDQLVKASEEAGVAFQFVLFHHGSFSSRVNPNWQDHPWNKAKGGFLEKAADFFTNPEAKRRTKMWLRYAVARWGHSPSIMAWELFNEVEWVDARYEERWQEVVDWHKEMSAYLRSIDPYAHMVATSSTFEFPDLYDAVDFYQPHVYPPDVRTAISGFKLPGDKPLFFGEYGPGVLDRKGQRMDVRDGIWAGILSGHAGAGAFWTWEVVEKEKLIDEYKVANQVILESGVKDHPSARPIKVRALTQGMSDLSFNPGTGWAKAEKTKFAVEAGSKPEGLGGLPSFLQAPAKREMFPEPLTFTFNATKPGVFTLQLAQVSKAGAKLRFTLNGKQVAEKAYPATANDSNIADKLTVPYQPGPNEIQIENIEADWVAMRSFTFSGMDFEASVQALGQVDWLLVRITANPGSTPSAVNLGSLGLAAGDYNLTLTDLDTGKTSKDRVRIASITHQEKIGLPGKDVMAVFSAVK